MAAMQDDHPQCLDPHPHLKHNMMVMISSRRRSNGVVMVMVVVQYDLSSAWSPLLWLGCLPVVKLTAFHLAGR